MAEQIRVLVVEDDPADARLVGVMLRKVTSAEFQVTIANRLDEALRALAGGGLDVILADLSLPDSAGLATLKALAAAAPDLPVVVLTGNDDDAKAMEAMRDGAQDYLVKGKGDAFTLSRVVRYAIERKATERALTDARDKAEQAARAKSLFLATVGHEIRTPLNGILGMARLLADTHLDQRQRTFAETVLASGELLLNLVNDILDFSRLEAEGLTLEEVAFDLPDMVDELRLMMAPRAAEKGITLGSRFAPGISPHVVGDPLRLRQVLLNLVGNAIKFTERGGVMLGVEKQRVLEDGRQLLRVTVSDTGVGIPEEARAGMFTEFSQADSSITRRFGGTGLGLAICKKLVTLMGGEIGYDSRAGEGSTFWFTVPFAVAETVEVPNPAPLPQVEAAHVLLVDDNPVNREVALGLLERKGQKVTAVEDGYAALTAMELASEGFDLVLLDMRMPGLDGIETARRMRALGGAAAHVPIWLLTANPAEEDEPRWRAAGIDGCFAKPFRVEEVLALLASQARPGQASRDGVQEPALLNLPDLLADMKDLGRDRMKGLAELLRRSSSSDLALAQSHAEAGDLAALGGVVHRMASAASSLHLVALTESCRALENLARAENPAVIDQAKALPQLWERSMKALSEVVE